MSLSYPVVLVPSEEGYAVGCPALPGCWSQGKTEDEALRNIRGAIQDYLAAIQDSLRGSDVREVEGCRIYHRGIQKTALEPLP